jgi:pimeloyl-ACP methyl ester carboxylesterase
MKVLSDSGQGRAFLLLVDDPRYQSYANTLHGSLSQTSRSVIVEVDRISSENWSPLTNALIELLGQLKIRQSSFVGFGAAGALCQNLALLDSKLVRTLILVDPSARPHPSRLNRTLDKFEEILPLGLPLRLRNKDFDSKPFLQRLRCPSLLALSPLATAHERHQAQIMDARMPTAWMLELPSQDTMQALCNATLEFQGVPVKCPQKARKRELSTALNDSQAS